MDWILIGMALIFIGIFVIILGSSKSSNVEWAFGGFIGPIPFGFAKNKKMLYILLAIISIFFVLTLLMQKKFI